MASCRDQTDGSKRSPGSFVRPIRYAEFVSDVAVAGNDHHRVPVKVQSDGFGHCVFPYALGHIKIFKIPPARQVMEFENFLKIGTVGRA